MKNKYEIKKIDFCEVCHKPTPEEEITVVYDSCEIFGKPGYGKIRKCLKCVEKK